MNTTDQYSVITEVIKTRRSIFPPMFSGVPIEDAKVMDLLENANWAPNHRKTEPWRFHVFTGEALKKLGAYLANFYKENVPAEIFSDKKYQKMMRNPTLASHVVAICMKRDPEGILPEWEELAAVSAAVQNLWLSCSAMGLGGYWSTPRAALHADEFLGLGADEHCYGLFYLGTPKEDLDLKGERGAIDQKVIWHKD